MRACLWTHIIYFFCHFPINQTSWRKSCILNKHVWNSFMHLCMLKSWKLFCFYQKMWMNSGAVCVRLVYVSVVIHHDFAGCHLGMKQTLFLHAFFFCNYIMLSMLGKIFSRWHSENFFFLIFPRKEAFTFHKNSPLRRQFARNVKASFLGKVRKISWICHLLNLSRGW